jgi:hypothetical protein
MIVISIHAIAAHKNKFLRDVSFTFIVISITNTVQEQFVFISYVFFCILF